MFQTLFKILSKPVKSLNPTEQLLVVATTYQHLSIVFDCMSQQRKWANVEIFLLFFLKLFLTHLTSRFREPLRNWCIPFAFLPIIIFLPNSFHYFISTLSTIKIKIINIRCHDAILVDLRVTESGIYEISGTLQGIIKNSNKINNI